MAHYIYHDQSPKEWAWATVLAGIFIVLLMLTLPNATITRKTITTSDVNELRRELIACSRDDLFSHALVEAVVSKDAAHNLFILECFTHIEEPQP